MTTFSAPLVDAGGEDASLGPLPDLIAWSWSGIAPELRDGLTDPSFVAPYVDAQAEGFYWELHLENARLTRTDFLHRSSLARGLSGGGRSPDPILGRLRDWYAHGDTAERCHGSAWLELDGPLVGSAQGRRQGVSVCLDPRFGTPGGGDPSAFAHSASAVVALFERLQVACGAEPRGCSALARVSDAAVTFGGVVRHLSVMRGRIGAPGKMYIVLPKPALAPFLRQVDWPGNIREAERMADVACADSEQVNADLEFVDGLGARIGYELFFDPSPALEPFRRAATRRALQMGLISSRQVAGLESWVGDFRKQIGNQLWGTRIQRWFDSKFVTHPSGRRELKAYLGFRLCNGIF